MIIIILLATFNVYMKNFFPYRNDDHIIYHVANSDYEYDEDSSPENISEDNDTVISSENTSDKTTSASEISTESSVEPKPYEEFLHSSSFISFTNPIPDERYRININTASAFELTTLKGIGDVKARAIIEYREKNGDFESVEDLTKVKGIGEKTLEAIINDITV